MIPFREDALRRWQELKTENPSALVGVQLGDYCEFYYDHAATVATALTLTLTSVNLALPAAVPMAAFPAASSASYVAALEALGHTVIFAED